MARALQRLRRHGSHRRGQRDRTRAGQWLVPGSTRLDWGCGVLRRHAGRFAQLEVTFEDGHVQHVGTDERWRAGASAVLANDLYDGETIDARRDDGLASAGFRCRPTGWASTPSNSTPRSSLPTPRLRSSRGTSVPVEKIWTSPVGKTLVDFGQNVVGYVRVRTRGPAGTEIVVRHAEVLEQTSSARDRCAAPWPRIASS